MYFLLHKNHPNTFSATQKYTICIINRTYENIIF